jgi:hypothetical protein
MARGAARGMCEGARECAVGGAGSVPHTVCGTCLSVAGTERGGDVPERGRDVPERGGD